MNSIEQLKIKRILSWRKFEPTTDYPETAQPQNTMTLTLEETQRPYKLDMVYKYLPMEAQNAN